MQTTVSESTDVESFDVDCYEEQKCISIERFSHIVLEITCLLLESGANSERINKNIQRISLNTNYNVDLIITFSAVSVSIIDKNDIKTAITRNKQISHHGVQFNIVTQISLLTWKLIDDKISWNNFESSFEQIKQSPKHPIWLVRISIGIACCCLCLLSLGNYMDGLFAFIASTIGLITRQEMTKKGFNTLICITSASFVTTTIASIDVLFKLGISPETAIATSVLYLIPGVPLINGIIDILKGYVSMGIARGALGASILLCIAVGMFLSMNLIGINNF